MPGLDLDLKLNHLPIQLFEVLHQPLDQQLELTRQLDFPVLNQFRYALGDMVSSQWQRQTVLGQHAADRWLGQYAP